jgi:uncharacterized protein (DUF4415 family)
MFCWNTAVIGWQSKLASLCLFNGIVILKLCSLSGMCGNMNNFSETNWEMIKNMTDETIDRSELPPLDDSFFDRATWRMPKESVAVTVQLDPDLLAWFQALGNDYQQRMIAALRIYAEAHKDAVPQTVPSD